MKFALESYMESEGLPETERLLLRQQANHSFSLYRRNGEHLEHPLGKEDLLAVLTGMERFMVDNNSSWKKEAAKPENRDKAFIVGDTIMDEPYDLEGNLFSNKVDISNNNIFAFGAIDWQELAPYLAGPHHLILPPCLTIDRFDSYFQILCDKEKLRRDSRPRTKRTDAHFLEREWKRAYNDSDARAWVLQQLGLREVVKIALVPDAASRQAKIIQTIRSEVPNCFKDYVRASNIAYLCYAALLLEPSDKEDSVGWKTRNEFNDTGNVNVFGDTRLVRDALWFGSRILSSDGAVKRMAEYIATPNIKTTGMV